METPAENAAETVTEAGAVWSRALRIRSEHVDMTRQLRTSSLLRMLQEASIAHTTELGMGREKTLDRGYLWVISRQYARILRMPVYDEEILLRSWPGEMLHVFFPRFYEIVSAESGEVLVQAQALWMLLDEATRRFVFPAEAGVEIRGRKEEPDRILRGSLRAPAGAVLTAEQRWTAPFSRIDINGHVGNAAYFDLLDDLLHGEGGPAGTGCAAGTGSGSGSETGSGGPRGITAEYLTEVRPGAELRLRLLRVPGDGDAETYYFEGVSADGGKPFFRIEMQMDRDTEEKQ